MNKGELIEAIAGDVGVSKTGAGKVLNSTIDAMIGALGKGDRITLVGFGTFSVSTRKARSGRTYQDSCLEDS
jgi:DNA-binding protein HU-beta